MHRLKPRAAASCAAGPARALFVAPTAAHRRRRSRQAPPAAHSLRLAREGLLSTSSVLASRALIWASLVGVATRHRGIFALARARILLVARRARVRGAALHVRSLQGVHEPPGGARGHPMLPSIGQQLWFDRWTRSRRRCSLPRALASPSRSSARSSRRSPARRAAGSARFRLVARCSRRLHSPGARRRAGQPPDILYVSAMGQLARARWDHNETVERVHPGPRYAEPPSRRSSPSRP